jgi:hypothetical protein
VLVPMPVPIPERWLVPMPMPVPFSKSGTSQP